MDELPSMRDSVTIDQDIGSSYQNKPIKDYSMTELFSN